MQTFRTRRPIFALLASLLTMAILLASGRLRAEVVSRETVTSAHSAEDPFYTYIDPSFPSFNSVFNLWITPGVEAEWDSLLIADFIEKVMNDDPADTDDVFPQIWDYFCFGDADSTYAGIQVELGREEYTKIDLFLSHQADVYPECEWEGLCNGGGFYVDRTNDIYLSITGGPRAGPWTVRSTSDIANSGFAHELQHLSSGASRLRFRGFPEEAVSMAAEYMRRAWRWHIRGSDVAYDASIWDSEICDRRLKYFVWLPWISYFLERTRLDPLDITDDAIYRWIRSPVINMAALAAVLDGDEFAHLDGPTGNDRLRNLYADYMVAKFADAPHSGAFGRFGFETDFSPHDHSGLMHKVSKHYESCDLDGDEIPETPPCPEEPVDCPFDMDNTAPCGCGAADWHVRIVPPNYELGSSHENVMTRVSGVYTDGDDTADPSDGDGSHDYIDVATYGTDYIIFRTGDYYQNGERHEFRFTFLGASSSLPLNTKVVARAIAYGSEVYYSAARDTLYSDPETILFVEPLLVSSGGTAGSIVVPDFGAGVKSVVIALAFVEGAATQKQGIEYFTYSYRYGVYTPALLPSSYALVGAYPNPFNPAIRIAYDVPYPGGQRVCIDVYDVRGKLVKRLLNRVEQSGEHVVEWNGGEEGASSGVYFVRMTAGTFKETRKIVLVK